MATLQADVNIYVVSDDPHAFHRGQECSRVDIFNDLDVHSNEGEEGFIMVIAGDPIIRIGDRTCHSSPGDVFHFGISEDHGIESGEGTVLVFHGKFMGRYTVND